MRSFSRLLVAAITCLALSSSPPVAAQQVQSHILFFFRNDTQQPAWITFREGLCKAVIGCQWVIIKEGDRRQTGPRDVRAKSNTVFRIPRYGRIRLQAEPMRPNNSAITSTEIEVGNIRPDSPVSVSITLKFENGRYWLER